MDARLAQSTPLNMCGIAGFFDPKHTVTDVTERLALLQRELHHRGPDDQGAWSSPSRVAHFAHTRLSILDLSAAGHQPMSDASGRYTITFNGEIYNFRELRGELEKEGAVFVSDTDTEVLLHLYARHGPSMLERLRGMFAFAIWDEKEQQGFLARDPFGIKPLYYTSQKGVVAFASEMRALQAASFTPHSLDPVALVSYFETGTVPEPLTLLSNVKLLEAGHWLEWSQNTLKKQAYWTIRFPASPVTEKPAQVVRRALLDSLRHHFVSDVPVGIFLSGGIDSTVLVALAREIGIKNLSTFSIGLTNRALDESSLARRTAEHFGTDHHELILEEEDAKRRFGEYLEHIDQPSIDGFNTYVVSSFAHECGIKVVLSGLGGDELFAGYPSFRDVPRLVKLSNWLNLIPGLRQHLGFKLEHGNDSQRAGRLGGFFQAPSTIRNAYLAFRGIFTRRTARLLAAQFAGVPISQFMVHSSEKVQPTMMPNPSDEVSHCELTLYMRNQLLRDSDVMSMKNSLELRVPFVDRVLFETVSRIPAAVRLQHGKKLLLEAVPEIPDWIKNQPKRGFLFPYETWAKSTWGDVFLETNRRLPIPNPTWYQQWCIFVLHFWLKRRGFEPESR